ncbi:hypothetical protein TNIN_94221 [Trichonephila inaurata madagascariensis]|uniref:Uncharacterized protein n=1 Tax=Trichonephila inaurata madagascariensis TaxID=2747483 RepID=A0A8X6WZM9_9ARAC|nr:hypothetical protein TNIN_94221 [Trichonephila inaurata madagascariensis]
MDAGITSYEMAHLIQVRLSSVRRWKNSLQKCIKESIPSCGVRLETELPSSDKKEAYPAQSCCPHRSSANAVPPTCTWLAWAVPPPGGAGPSCCCPSGWAIGAEKGLLEQIKMLSE